MKEPKIVGHLNGEPVFECEQLPSSSDRDVPIKDGDAEHRLYCMPCLFNTLLDPLEEFEQFIENAHLRVLEIDATPREADVALALHSEREHLITDMALAAFAITNLKAMILTAAKYL